MSLPAASEPCSDAAGEDGASESWEGVGDGALTLFRAIVMMYRCCLLVNR